VASTKAKGRTARTKKRKPYVPSAEQRAEDERLRKELANADMSKFDKIFEEADWASAPPANKQ
jgi:hypothetical protein